MSDENMTVYRLMNDYMFEKNFKFGKLHPNCDLGMDVYLYMDDVFTALETELYELFRDQEQATVKVIEMCVPSDWVAHDMFGEFNISNAVPVEMITSIQDIEVC